ncbi:MAG: histidine kinase [Anaerocolumna sp.]
MKKIFNFKTALRKMDIKYRLIISFLIVSILPLIFISFYSNHLNSKAMKSKISDSTAKLLSMVNTNMVTEIEKYQYLCGSICVNQQIQDALLVENYTSGEKNKIINNIQSLVKTKIIYPAQAKNITILDKKGEIFYDLGYDGFYDKDMSAILKNLVKNAPNDSWTYVKTYRSRDILVLGRRTINQFDTSEVLGYTLVSIDEKLFSETVLSPVKLNEGSNIIFMDTDGIILSSWNRSLILGKPFPDSNLLDKIKKQHKKSGSFEIVIDDNRQLITYFYNKNIDKYFVSFIPFSYLNSESNIITKDLTMTAAIVILICSIIIILIYLSISTPVKKMVATCQKISEGNLNERIDDLNLDELGYLSKNIDDMVDKIKELLENQQYEEQRKRKLELKVLQYQINPHFLFNTLNTLRLVASMNHDMVVSTGIQSLSELLRNALIDQNEFIPIEEEINNLKHYFAIQTIRYAGNFQVTYELDLTLLSYLTPKLILQPLAENAIMHGAKNDGSILDIMVKCYAIDMDIILELTDNGKGFDPGDNKKPEGLGGFGSQNVNDRIMLNFGEPYGLLIKSEPGKGTLCEVKIPRII